MLLILIDFERLMLNQFSAIENHFHPARPGKTTTRAGRKILPNPYLAY